MLTAPLWPKLGRLVLA
ncbi:hypothetical protein HU200_039158 [Digitaria exilis]|uniref:Uncharacterized protein n=1 Tax=Digitaria exilis TaxID=1010633 RepID=A0A835EKA6_9POAL|nr:hypothetical protein HU200_039158 [Digitaria exilis]